MILTQMNESQTDVFGEPIEYFILQKKETRIDVMAFHFFYFLSICSMAMTWVLLRSVLFMFIYVYVRPSRPCFISKFLNL